MKKAALIASNLLRVANENNRKMNKGRNHVSNLHRAVYEIYRVIDLAKFWRRMAICLGFALVVCIFGLLYWP